MSFTVPEKYPEITVDYSALAGVDLSSDTREINKSRASRCINMYRCYTDGANSFLQTRPGFKKLGSFGGRIYGIHFISSIALVHAQDGLYIWNSFPNAPSESDLIPVYTMAKRKSVSFVFGKRLYILDGENYIYFENGNVKAVEGFIPTTKIGDGESFQGVNLLSPYRKNSFRGDGKTTLFYLDTTEIDLVDKVYVNDTVTTAYTSDLQKGTITFTTAPAAPLLGDDNIVVVFKKEIAGYRERISGCKVACVFDNRVFFSSNSANPGLVFVSELQDPTYISDTNYYDDGDGEAKVMALAVKENKLTVIKDRGSNSVYTHTPTLSYELGRIYPAKAGAVSVGCKTLNGAAVFRDDLVYLSEQGLEGIGNTEDLSLQRALNHRSTLADGGLLKEDLENACLCRWQGYLCILAGDKVYLADSRNIFYNGSSFEYEWYVWQGLYSENEENKACILKERENILYFGTENGSICAFSDSLKDEDRAIESLWESRCETAGAAGIKKSVTKAGCVLLLKRIVNSKVEVWAQADTEEERLICTLNMGGFDFANMNFSSLSFTSDEDNLVAVPLNEKAFKTLKLKIRSDTNFGFGRACYIAKLHNHIKN